MKLSFSSNFLYEFKGLGNLSRQRSIDRQTTFKTGRKQIFGNWNIFCLGPLKLLNTDYRGLLPLEKKLILVHITTQGRTQWRTPPRFDPRFLLYFHKIVRLTATGLSISPSSKSLCLLFPPKSPLVSN